MLHLSNTVLSHAAHVSVSGFIRVLVALLIFAFTGRDGMLAATAHAA